MRHERPGSADAGAALVLRKGTAQSPPLEPSGSAEGSRSAGWFPYSNMRWTHRACAITTACGRGSCAPRKADGVKKSRLIRSPGFRGGNRRACEWPADSRGQRIAERSAANPSRSASSSGVRWWARRCSAWAVPSRTGCCWRFTIWWWTGSRGGFCWRICRPLANKSSVTEAGGFAFQNGVLESLVGRIAGLGPFGGNRGGSGVLGIGFAAAGERFRSDHASRG